MFTLLFRAQCYLTTYIYFSSWQLWTVALWLIHTMARLLSLLEQHLDRQPSTVVIQATTWWETELALVKLQEIGLRMHLPVKVCYYTLCICVPFMSILRILLRPFLDQNDACRLLDDRLQYVWISICFSCLLHHTALWSWLPNHMSYTLIRDEACGINRSLEKQRKV